MGRVLAQFDYIFSRFGRSQTLCTISTAEHIFVENGREWMKWHGRRPGSCFGMLMEHVGWGLPQFDAFLHNLVSIAVVDMAAAPSGFCTDEWK